MPSYVKAFEQVKQVRMFELPNIQDTDPIFLCGPAHRLRDCFVDLAHAAGLFCGPRHCILDFSVDLATASWICL